MAHTLIHTHSGVIAAASIVGKTEKKGPIGDCFDLASDDDRFGQRTWEMAEAEMQRRALHAVLAKTQTDPSALDAVFAGDLLNQCIGAAYGLKDFGVPYFGLYGACSTFTEGIVLSSLLIGGGSYGRCAAVASSHNCTAERQYRTPIEYGGQRPPTAQWTATAAGAILIGKKEECRVRIPAVMPGIVVERGVRDLSNMGAAMAPAAADTLLRFFTESGQTVSDFDLIVTGDLGYEGGDILCELMMTEGIDLRPRYNDCGMMLYNRAVQDTHAGGSGCGCSAAVFASYLLPKLQSGELRRVLLLGTGAMMSPLAVQQGEAIPAIAHLAVFTSEEEETE